MPVGDQSAQQFAWIALHYSLLNEHAKAAEFVRRAVADLPPGGGMFQRAPTLDMAGLALARTGDIAGAATLLRQAVSIPFPRSAKGMWCDPLAAPLRRKAEFRAVMQQLGADVSIDPARRETWPAAVLPSG
jgi:hypothetical protein